MSSTKGPVCCGWTGCFTRRSTIRRTTGSSPRPTPRMTIRSTSWCSARSRLSPLTLVTARAIGLMTMIDGGKRDHKILAVAIDDPEFNSFREAAELPPHRLMMLRRFFQDYKQLEGKSVEVDEFQPAETALPIIEESLQRYSQHRRRGFH